MSINIISRTAGADASLGAGPGILARNPKATDPLAGLLSLRLEGANATPSLWTNTGSTGAVNNAVQAVPTNQPTIIASDAAFNNQPSVLGNTTSGAAAGSWMPTLLALNAPFTLIMVFRAAASPGTPIQSVESNNYISVNQPSFSIRNAGGNIVDNSNAWGTAAHITTLEIGTESRVYRDGVDVTDSGGTGLVGNFGTLNLGVADNAGAWAGALAAVGVYFSVDAVKRALVNSVWKTKYGTP